MAAIDWQRPWFAPYRSRGQAVEAWWRKTGCAADALNRHGAGDLRFVAADRLPAGQPYELFVHSTRSVPTRSNLHDLFNGLVWLAFPMAKRRLNALQAGAIRAAGVAAVRGPLRDAVTVFDENGALLQAPQALHKALAARDWRRLFVELRPLWQSAHFVPFGHALLEKLVRPRKAICAHVLPVDANVPLDRLDAALAARLSTDWLTSKPFLPLPVLGIPRWWAENEDPAFYDDATVFRPERPQT